MAESIPEKTQSYNLDLATLIGWSNVASGAHTLTIKAKADGYLDSPASNGVTFEKEASISLNWRFNGAPKKRPTATLTSYVEISGAAYDSDGFIEDFNYIYYENDWSYIQFGSAGFWNINNNTFGAPGGNILKFDTAPSGDLLIFLQTNAEPI